MKKIIIITCFLLKILVLQAQNGHSIDIVAGSGLSFGTKLYELSSVDYQNKLYLGGRLGANYSIDKEEDSYKIGLHLVRTGNKSSTYDLNRGTQHNGNGGFIPNTTPTTEIYSAYWVEIPLIFHHKFMEKNWSPYIEAGCQGALNLSYKYKMVGITNKENVSLRPSERFAIGGLLAFGIEHKMKNNNIFFIQGKYTLNWSPYIRVFNTNPTAKNTIAQTNLITLETGIRLPIK